jgi:pyruvate formate lyase activating enzyme
MQRGLVFDVKRYSIHDGPGIRTTVFLQGCPLSCTWCHNPESRSPSSFVHVRAGSCIGCGSCAVACPEGAITLAPQGMHTDETRCQRCWECVEACPAACRELVGKEMSVDEVLAEIDKDRVYYEETHGGATFSGGEPLLQPDFLLALLRACGERGIHRAVDTCGHAPTELLLRVAQETELFLYDLKTLDVELHQRTTGVPLEGILANLRELARAGSRVRVRIPLIPGISDADENVDRAGELLRSLPGVDDLSVLPYHASARNKHARFGLPWRMEHDEEIPEERVREIARRFEGFGLNVHVGG